MLDSITNTAETHFRRQVTPSVEGNLRPQPGKEGATSSNSERVIAREANRLEQQEIARNRREQQVGVNESSRQLSERASQDASQAYSKAAEMAEKLAKVVKESRREEARQAQKAHFSHPNQTRQVNRAYMGNLPIEQNRILDEMA